MSLPEYQDYKVAKVEGVDKIPSHWELPPMYLRYEVELGKMLDTRRITGESLMPYLRNIDVQWGHVNFDDLPEMDVELREVDRYTIRSGDLLVCEGGEVGRAAVVEQVNGSVAFQKALHRLRPVGAEEISKYMFYIFRWACDSGVFTNNGQSTIAHLTAEQLRKYRFPRPPKNEQGTIVDFLDREVAKINALIAEQKRLLALLAEKRQAVISHVVTRGLDADVLMKDSGVAWIGEIPSHWKLRPLKCLTQPDRPIMYGIVLPGPDVGEGVPILKGGNVKPSRMCLSEMARTTPEIEAPYARARLRKGDLVYAIRGTIGDCEIVPAEMEGSNITQDVARVAVDGANSASWVRWALLASAVREELACGSLGAAVRGVNIYDLKRVRLPVPPKEEQEQIAEHINREVEKIDELVAECEKAMNLMREHRSALISAAVTGKIDVRGLVGAKAAA
ncbi:MAG: restriction endonuclease subunit S [Lysobacter sp.]|nr:restriction endonuclease subunit S [Lysobacter sp.]